jgi:hypothetical protein
VGANPVDRGKPGSKLHLVCDGGGLPRIVRRGIESSTRLGRHRWRIERALSWLSCFRRLQVRWDRDAGRWFAFVLVACAVVCFNRLYQPGERHDVLGQRSFAGRSPAARNVGGN